MQHYHQQINGFFTYPEFYSAIVKVATDGYHFVEVGSWKGSSASYMGVEIINANKKITFDCVDTWEGSAEHLDKSSAFYEPLLETKDGLFNCFMKNISPIKHIVNVVRNTSVDASKLYAPNSVDCVFIDAAHDYINVYNDIKAWLPIVKTNGLLAGHDIHHPPIHKAVYDMLGKFMYTNEDVWAYKVLRTT
jgi:hypothetical protein